MISLASKFGTATEVFNGVDLTVNARLPRGIVVSGGPSIGRTETNYCFAVDSPQGAGAPPAQGATSAAGLLYCDVKPPFQPNVKLLGVYPLPWQGVQVAATFQSLPGPQITASRTYTNAEILPSLGRNLASGAAGTASVPLIAPGTMYDERLYQLDFRASKIFKFGQRRLQANLDLYNAGNASSILSINTTYGSNWLRPTGVLQGRLSQVRRAVRLLDPFERRPRSIAAPVHHEVTKGTKSSHRTIRRAACAAGRPRSRNVTNTRARSPGAARVFVAFRPRGVASRRPSNRPVPRWPAANVVFCDAVTPAVCKSLMQPS